MNESNMFSELGQCGFYVNSFGFRQNIILVENKKFNSIFCKDSIPLGNKVYVGIKDNDCTYLGTVEGCAMSPDTSVGDTHELVLCDCPNVSDTPIYKPTLMTIPKDKKELQ